MRMCSCFFSLNFHKPCEYFLQHSLILDVLFKKQKTKLATYPIGRLHIWQPVLDAGLCLGVEPMAFQTQRNICRVHPSAMLKLWRVPATTAAPYKTLQCWQRCVRGSNTVRTLHYRYEVYFYQSCKMSMNVEYNFNTFLQHSSTRINELLFTESGENNNDDARQNRIGLNDTDNHD